GEDGYLNVVGKDRTGTDLFSLIQAFPPVRFGLNVQLAKCGRHADELGKLRISFRTHESKPAEYHEDGERKGGVTPRASKRLRKVASKELFDTRPALGVSLVDAAMRADH